MAWLFRATPPSRSIRVPLLMVTVAIATGPVTYLAIGHASDATDHEEQRLHATVEQAFLEHQVEAQVAFEQRLFGNYVAHEALQRAHVAAASADPQDPTHHHLAAQAEWDQVMVTYGGFSAAYPRLSSDGKLEYPEDVARTSLRETLDGGRLVEVERSIADEGAATKRLRAASLLIVATIVGLILSLVFLTLAQVSNDRWRTRTALVGVPIAIVSLTAVVWIEMIMEASGWVAIFGAVVIAVLLVLSIGDRFVPWLKPVLGQRGDVASDSMGETSATGSTRVSVPHPGELDSLFSRIVVVIVALATLCGAWVAYLQADAFGHADSIGFQARREAIGALTSGTSIDSRAASQIVAYEQSLISDVAVMGANQRLRYYETLADQSMHHEAQTDLAHLTTIADSLREVVPPFPDGLGPADDDLFPTRLRAQIRSVFDQHEAEDEAHHDQSAEWQRRGAHYAALLVVLAVTVYLLGLSLILPGHRLPVAFALVAVGGLAMAFSWSAWTLVEKPASEQVGAEQTIKEAATAFQKGRFHLQAGEFPAAVESLELATTLQGSLGRAHSDLALAIYDGAASQEGPYPGKDRSAELARSISELEKAQSTGFDTFGTRMLLGWERLLATLYEQDDSRRAEELLRASVDASESATRVRPGHPVPVLNLALAQVIAGDADAATTTYGDAIEYALDRPEESQLLADALTDLQLVERFRPELRSSVKHFKEMVVAGFARLSGPASTPVALTIVNTVAFPGSLGWTARLPDFEPRADSMVQVWYHRDVDQRWSAVPTISTVLASPAAENLPDRGFVTFDQSDQPGEYFADAGYAKAFWQCVPADQYRVEIYVNGRLAGTSKPISTEATRVADARDLGILSCVPSDWKQIPRAEAKPGFVDAWMTESRDRGLVLARIHYPVGTDPGAQAVAALDWLCAPGVSGLCEADVAADRTDVSFLDLNAKALGYGIEGKTEYLALSGVATGGTVLAAVLFGPADFMSSDLAIKYAISHIAKTTLGPSIGP